MTEQQTQQAPSQMGHAHQRAELVKELVGVLERSQAGLQWYMAEYPNRVTGADHEMQEEIDAVLAKAKAAEAAHG